MDIFTIIFITILAVPFIFVTGKKPSEKPSWAKKDIRDFNDGDMEQLFTQWEEDEEPLEPDELPVYLRPKPSLDLSKMNLDPNNTEERLKVEKKGQLVFAHVTILGNTTREETEKIAKLWQLSLWNNHIQSYLHLLADDTTIFMFEDGSLAWDAKDYLIQQERCKEVTIENESYNGIHFKPASKSVEGQTNKIKSNETNIKEEL